MGEVRTALGGLGVGGRRWANEALKREWGGGTGGWEWPGGGPGRRDCMEGGWLCGGRRWWSGERGAPGLPWAAIACNCREEIRKGYFY